MPEILVWDTGNLVGISDPQQALMAWAKSTIHDSRVLPDFHRLQLEHWLFTRLAPLRCTKIGNFYVGRKSKVLDIGVEIPRRWLGGDYTALGSQAGDGIDVVGDALEMPFSDASYDVVICTEMLEHCADPVGAVREMHRVLRPGGTVLVTSPFLWPWHGRDDEETSYPDYWRFTHQGWELLLRPFTDVQITPVAWTANGGSLYGLLRQAEGWGFDGAVEGHTGYLCSGVK
jgi:SAM-dependent methyltransferase